MYRQPVDSLEDLVVRIHAAVASITPETLRAVQRQLVLRAEACIDAEGTHIEQLFN